MSDKIAELRQQTRAEYLAGLRHSWRGPAQRGGFQPSGKPDSGDTSDARTARDARLEMIKRGSEAWRTPHKDWAEPDLGSRPAELRRRQEEPDDNAAHQRRRDQVYEDYKARLKNAWRETVVGFGTAVVGARPEGPIGPGPARGGR